jgi:hypothetical protein
MRLSRVLTWAAGSLDGDGFGIDLYAVKRGEKEQIKAAQENHR